MKTTFNTGTSIDKAAWVKITLALASPCLVALWLSACGSTTAGNGNGGEPPTVTTPRTQILSVDPDIIDPTVPLGRILFTSSGATTGLEFILMGDDAGLFLVDRQGQIFLREQANRPTFPLTFVVNVRFGSQVLASSTLILNRLAGFEINNGQSFMLSDARVGARLGQIVIRFNGERPNLDFALTGTGSEYFNIDAEGIVTVGRALTSDEFSYNLTIDATENGGENITIRNVITIVPGIVLQTRLFPSPATTIAIDAGGGALSETTPTSDTCLVNFAPNDLNSGCWSFYDTSAFTQAGLSPTLSLTTADRTRYAIVDNRLMLAQPYQYNPSELQATTPPTLRITINGRDVRQSQTDTIVVAVPVTPPSIVFTATTIDDVPLIVSDGIIATLNFRILNGAPTRSLTYTLSDIPSGLPLRIDNTGALRIDPGHSALTANQTYTVTVTAQITGLSGIDSRQTVSFTATSVQVRFSQRNYTFVIELNNNQAGSLVGVVVATGVSASTNLRYEITNDTNNNFRIDQDGKIYLTKAISGNSDSAQVRASMGEASATANFTANLRNADFTAFPVDEAVDRLNIQFTAMVPSRVTANSYAWNFGDNSGTSAVANPVYRFSQPGPYRVSLTVGLQGGATGNVEHTVYAHRAEDPLQRMQWYLEQDTISPFLGDSSQVVNPSDGTLNDIQYRSSRFNKNELGPPVELTRANEDIRAIDFIESCGVLDTCRGEGVVVLVADRGAQLTHPELAPNSRRNLSRNLNPSAPDPNNPYMAPLFPGNRSDVSAALNRRQAHGTSSAGIIVASDANDIGLSGIAPKAELASYNLLDSNLSGIDFMTIFTADFDVMNNSWSMTSDETEFLTVLRSVVTTVESVLEKRNGKGAIVIKSSGNDGTARVNYIGYDSPFGNRHNSSGEYLSNLRFVNVVGGALASGRENPQSEAGSNVLLSGYWPYPCQYSPASATQSTFDNPVAILTTDLVGEFGYTWGISPLFITTTTPGSGAYLGALTLNGMTHHTFLVDQNPTVTPIVNFNDYNYCFGGTSASGPMVAGAAALMIQARPELTWRDARVILARTARPTNTSDTGWVTNAANLRHHPSLGFGIVNVEAAVDLAKTWDLLPDEIEISMADETPTVIADCTGSCGQLIRNTGTSTSRVLTTNSRMDTIESINVDLTLSIAPRLPVSDFSVAERAGLQIVLEHLSESGEVVSRSLLHKRHHYYSALGILGVPPDFDYEFNWNYLTVVHLGESIRGTWRLVVTDFFDDDASITLDGWDLTFYGHNNPN